MLQATRGIVLRAVKYGETSLVVTVYTELFGIQHYLVQGVRTLKKGGTQANLFQPASLLDMVVYHHPNKHLQRIKEFKAAHIYRGIQQDPLKNSVALFMVELVYRLITEEESHPEWFEVLFESFLQLDGNDALAAANTPLMFSLMMCKYTGFSIESRNYREGDVFDLENGLFCSYNGTTHVNNGDALLAADLHALLEQQYRFKANGEKRFQLLQLLLQFIQLHHPEMQSMRSLGVLHAIWH